ncbi:endonuclease IV [Thermococci archaeon]|nr:MAG: endonuclease IV [Thermococci archaeon]
MIWIGPAGIPLSCKGMGIKRGIECVREKGLSAMEVQFVRGVTVKREEVGKEIYEKSKEERVRLSVHAPYYINLASDDEKVIEKSKERIKSSCLAAHWMGASPVVVHAGYYSKRLGKKGTYSLIRKSLSEVLEDLNSSGITDVKIGIETMGKQKSFGTLDEVISLSSELEGVVPVIDFAHIHSRTNGGIRSREDYSSILDKLEEVLEEGVAGHIHFTCVEYSKGNERRHLTLEAKEPDFSPLAEELSSRDGDFVLISESPILEEDALKMKEEILKRGGRIA